VTAARSGKHQARPPIDHFKKLLEEAYPNHAYPVKHKLRDCDMMKNFMISGFRTQGIELDEVTDESDMMPFPGEAAFMTVYGGRPLQGGAMCLTWVLGPRLTMVGERTRECKGTSFLISLYIYMCVLICILQLLQKTKMREKDGRAGSLRP
jgi:hypothetical protein